MKGLPSNSELSGALKRLNLPPSGTKQVLMDRLGWAELTPFTEIFVDPQDSPKSWDLNFPTSDPTIKKIPKASRIQACKTLTDILTEVTNENSRNTWERLLQYPLLLLSGTARGGKNKKSQATLINGKIDSFIKGTAVHEKHKPQKSQPNLKDQGTSKLSMGDVSGAIRIISSSDTVLPPSIEIKSKLEEKHPPAHTKICLPPTLNTNFMICSRDDVKNAIKSFKPGSSGSPYGLLPQHLLDLTSEEMGEPALKLLDALKDFFNKVMFPGNVPKEVCATIFGANLIALLKPCGGIRPIAVAFSLRRLARKIVMKKLYGKCKEFFYPQQLGVGTPKGMESALHAVRAYVQMKKRRTRSS